MKKITVRVITAFVMVVVFAVFATMTTFAAETNEDWVYPEEVVTEFAEELGYTPSYEVEKWFENHWELAVDFQHIQFTFRIDRHDEEYDGWRMKRTDFENLMQGMDMYFVKGVESQDVYADYEIAYLFEEHYGYDVECEFDVYHDAEEMKAELVICDYYNGRKYKIDAILTTKGWMVPKENWETFTERYPLSAQVEYATEEVYWMDIGDLKEEFRARLGYTPKFELVEDEGDFYIEVTFDHLGGETYFIDYVYEKEGELLVSDRVLEKFWDENPETSVVLDLNYNQLWKLFWFYMLML